MKVVSYDFGHSITIVAADVSPGGITWLSPEDLRLAVQPQWIEDKPRVRVKAGRRVVD